MRSFRQGLTFDDVLLVPRRSAVHPQGADLRTRFARRRTFIKLLDQPATAARSNRAQPKVTTANAAASRGRRDITGSQTRKVAGGTYVGGGRSFKAGCFF